MVSINSEYLDLTTSFRLENSTSSSILPSTSRSLHLSIKIHAPPTNDGVTSVVNRAKEIIFLIDNSGSMEGDRLNNSKAAIVHLIKTCISEEDLVGIVKFSSSAVVEFPLTQIASAETKSAIIRSVERIGDEGCTNIQAGLITALSQFKTLDPAEIAGRQRIIIMLSDGEHNHSDSLNIPQISSLAAEKGCHGVYCVGIDQGIDLQTLISISTSCKGQFWSSFDGEGFLPELIKSFSKCFAGISTTVCSGLKLAVTCPKGPPSLVGPLLSHSISKSFTFTEKREKYDETALNVEIGQIIIDQSIHLSFCFECLDASQVGSGDSFRLELSYYNFQTNQSEVQTREVAVPPYLIGLEKGKHRLVQTSIGSGEVLQSEVVSITADEEFQLENTTSDRFFTLFLSPEDKIELHPSSVCVIAKVGSLPKRRSSADHETASDDAIFSCSLLKGTLYVTIVSYELEVEELASDSTKLSLKDSKKTLSIPSPSPLNGNKVLLREKGETSHVVCVDGNVEVPKINDSDEESGELNSPETHSRKILLRSLQAAVYSRRGETKEESVEPKKAVTLTSELHKPCRTTDLIDIFSSSRFREELEHETEENRKFANRNLSILSEALERKDKNQCKDVSQVLSDHFERSLATRYEAAIVAGSKSLEGSVQNFAPQNLPLLLSYQKVRSSVDKYLNAVMMTESESKRREAEIRVQNLSQTIDQERSMLEGSAEAFLYTTPIQQNIADKVLQISSIATNASYRPSTQMATILRDQEQLLGRQSVQRGLQAFLADPGASSRGGSLFVSVEVSRQRTQECQEQIKSSGETVQDRRFRRESKGPSANTFLESNLVTSEHRVQEVKALASGKVGGLLAMFEKNKK